MHSELAAVSACVKPNSASSSLHVHLGMSLLVHAPRHYLTSHEKLRSESRLVARLVIIDGPDSWAKELVTEKIAEKFYGIDFTDESTIFDRCLAKIKEAEKVTAHDHYLPVGGLSGLVYLACMAICWSCWLQALHMPL